MEASAPAPGSSSFGGGKKGLFVLSLLSLLYLSDYADRAVVAGMVSFIKADWHVTDAEIGWLTGIVILFITVFSLPASMLIDRWSRRKMISIMVFFWSMATLACAFTRTYVHLLVARAFIGVGEAGYAPAGTALLAAAYPEEKRARAMGIWNMFIPLGMGIGLAAGGLIAKEWGWRHAFGLVAVPGMIMAVVAWFLPDYRTVEIKDAPAERLEGFIADLKKIFVVPSLVLTYFGFAMNVSITTALMTWLPAYFERTKLAEPGKGGLFATSVLSLILIGAPLGGFLSDLWRKHRPEARLLFPAITSAGAAVFLFAAFQFPGRIFVQMPLLIGFGILVTCFVAPAAAVTQDVVHPGLRAFSYAMCVIVQHLAGDVWSPGAVGKLSDMIGLPNAMTIIPAWGVLAAIFFLIASRHYNADLARVEKVELKEEE